MFNIMKMENKNYIENFANQCGEKLFEESKIKEFIYPAIESLESWDKYYVDTLSSIKGNEKILKSVSRKSGVYALFVKNKSNIWESMYIGHTNCKDARQRIRNHLIKKGDRTGAQLSSIQNSVLKGNKIGISFLEIQPAYLRHAIEEILIQKNSKKLAWNKSGKAKVN